ncbi:N-formylglutamate amidohydrolase [Roseibium sp.]|uniref:N-formylglutamate amidohydrolase n=1 Tax=Roseibium sp. TaxID=1936156 RepID=UPI003D116CB8
MIQVIEGQSPLILCLPHSGTDVPKAVFKRLNATGRLQADVAWRLERVFDIRDELDATMIGSTISRYVIDLDKDPATPVGAAFDPALALCPATTLDGKRLYQDQEEPGPTEIEQRTLLFFSPFHKALGAQIDRLLRSHSDVIVIDCQSMRSHIKGVRDEELPLVNIGSANGTSCDPDLRNLLVGSFKGLEDYSVGVDDFIQGGFITRTYGQPGRGIHVLSLLLAQRAYLRHESPPFEPDKGKLARLKTVLLDSMSRLVDWTGVSSKARETASTSKSGPARTEDAADETEDGRDGMAEAPAATRDSEGGTGAPAEPLLVAE